MPNEKTIDTEKTVTVKTVKNEGGYDNLELTGSEYGQEKSAAKPLKPVKNSREGLSRNERLKESNNSQLQKQEETSKLSRKKDTASKRVKGRGRTDPFELPESAADDKMPPESDVNNSEMAGQKRESTSFDKNNKKVGGTLEPISSSLPTTGNKKKKRGCCSVL